MMRMNRCIAMAALLASASLCTAARAGAPEGGAGGQQQDLGLPALPPEVAEQLEMAAGTIEMLKANLAHALADVADLKEEVVAITAERDQHKAAAATAEAAQVVAEQALASARMASPTEAAGVGKLSATTIVTGVLKGLADDKAPRRRGPRVATVTVLRGTVHHPRAEDGKASKGETFDVDAHEADELVDVAARGVISLEPIAR